jgi:competence protein ComEC
MRAGVLLAFVAGVCLLQLQSVLPSAALLAALLVAALAVAIAAAVNGGGLHAPARSLMLLAAAGAVGFAYAAAMATVRMADELPFDHEGRDVVVEGVVASLPARLPRGVRFEFDVERVLTPGATVPRRLLLGWYGEFIPARPAERWQFTVRLKRPHGVQNPGGFDLEAWMLERNLRASGAVRSGRRDPEPRLVDALVRSPGYLVERARYNLRDRLAGMVEERRYGGVLLALILGDQRAIAAADWTLFNRTGISHLVSISGLHITMIASLVGWCVARLWRTTPALLLRVPAQAAAVFAGLAGAAGYALLAGWGIPAQRTVLMLTVVGAAWLARARIGMGQSLALAAAAVCIFDPWAVLAAGFWLSFGAVAAIVWVVQGRVTDPDEPAWRRTLRAAAHVQMAVTLALVPATIVLFHQFSLISPFANAVAIPVVSWVVTPLALLAGAFALLPAPLALPAELLLAVAHAVFSVLAAVLAWWAAFDWSMLPVATPPWIVTALAVCGVAWLLAPPGWPVRWAGTLALLPLFTWPAERPRTGELWVTALDVGQGSAVLVESSDRAWLYDTGPRYSSDSDAGERIVLPYLRHRGIRRLDGLIVSHLDGDHSGGAAAVLRGIGVGRLLTSIADGDPALGGRPPERCQAGAQWVDGPMQFVVLHPTADDYRARRSTNAMSCVVLARLGPRSVLLTGDVGVADEAAILARSPGLQVDWLAAPHHGSRSSSSAALLSALGAAEAVAQAGYRNRYGHPDATVVARYRLHGTELRRTDQSGALQWRLRSDGTARVSAWRTERVRYWHNRPRQILTTEEEGTDDPAAPALFEPFIAG